MKRYTFNMELGDFCLAVNDKSVGIGVAQTMGQGLNHSPNLL